MLWVRQPDEFPCLAKPPLLRGLPQAPLAPAPSRREPCGRPMVARAPTKTKFRRGGVSPPACRAKNPSKTIPQALSRQLPLPGSAFGLCEHCKLTCGASCACGVVRQPPTGFVRTLREQNAPIVGAWRLLAHTKLYPFLRKIQEVRKGKHKNSAAKCKKCVKSRARARVARVWLLLY